MYACVGTPTLQQLVKALQKLDDWHTFGIILRVPYSQLRKIESNHPKDSDRCKTEMLQYWLDSTLAPKWNDVILALEVIDKLTLAAQIKHDYLWTSAVSEEEGITCVNILFLALSVLYSFTS